MASEPVDDVHRGRVKIVADGEDRGVVRIGGRDHPRLATIERAARTVLRLHRQGRTVTVVSHDPQMRDLMALVGVSAWTGKDSSRRPMNVEAPDRLPFVAQSQEEATMTTITTISTVAIPTRDQEASKAFYIDRLGFEERVDVQMSVGFRWIEVATPGSDITVTLLAAGDEMPAGRDTGIRLVSTDAKAEHEAMKNAGVDVDDLLDWPDAPLMFAFRDEDANTLYLVETE